MGEAATVVLRSPTKPVRCWKAMRVSNQAERLVKEQGCVPCLGHMAVERLEGSVCRSERLSAEAVVHVAGAYLPVPSQSSADGRR